MTGMLGLKKQRKQYQKINNDLQEEKKLRIQGSQIRNNLKMIYQGRRAVDPLRQPLLTPYSERPDDEDNEDFFV